MALTVLTYNIRVGGEGRTECPWLRLDYFFASPALADRMQAAWIAFARGGNPNAAGLPSWPAYEPGSRATLIFDAECRVENDPGGAERRLWDGLL